MLITMLMMTVTDDVAVDVLGAVLGVNVLVAVEVDA